MQPNTTALHSDTGAKLPKYSQPATSGGMLEDFVTVKMKKKGSIRTPATLSGGVCPGVI